MEESPTEYTYVEIVDGVQVDCGLTSPHFVTNTEKHVAELDNPLVFICCLFLITSAVVFLPSPVYFLHPIP